MPEQRHVTEAEPVTVNNSLLTFHELLRYLQGRGRALPPDPVHTGTAAPTRALTSLKWLVRHGSLAWELTHLQAPKKIPKAQQRAQAAVILPPMLAHLEEQIELQHPEAGKIVNLHFPWIYIFARIYIPNLRKLKGKCKFYIFPKNLVFR